MSQEERYGTRDMSYSAWHRRHSTERFVGIENARRLAMIDLDASLYVEYDDKTKEPIALMEIAADVGQDHKTATVTRKLCIRAKIPGFIVLYRTSDAKNPADDNYSDISGFRIKLLYPFIDKTWRSMSPGEWAKCLLSLRDWATKKIYSHSVII